MRNLRNQTPIGFFRKWIEKIVSTQSGLDVAHRYLLIEGSKGCSEGRGGVPLNQHELWWERLKIITQPLKGRTGHVGEGLPWCHQIEIQISAQAKQIHHLRHHLPVLACQYDSGFQELTGPEFLDHRRQFDGFRPRAQDDCHAWQASHNHPDCELILRLISPVGLGINLPDDEPSRSCIQRTPSA